MRKIAIFMLLLMLTSFAEDYVVINSNDGRDVLSGVFYANVKNIPVKFVPVSGNVGALPGKVGANHDILLIQGTIPVSSFIEPELRNMNNTIELYLSADGAQANLDLAKRSGAARFIIVDAAYSESAVSVIPYAALTDSYVLFVHKDNIEEVSSIVSRADKIMIYGLVDQAVKDALEQYSPEYIGDGEDKFVDNAEIVSRTMEEFSISRLLIVDGTFLEESMTLGDQPILFCGRLVPEPTYNLLRDKLAEAKLNSVLLLGMDLVTPVHDARDKMEDEIPHDGKFSIITKFAQAGAGGVSALDTFPLPVFRPELEIGDVFYNDQESEVMLNINNIGEGSTYYNYEVRVKVNGGDYFIHSNNDTRLLERGDSLGTSFGLDLSSVDEGNVTALVIVKYGASKSSLDEYLADEGPLLTVTFVDNSNVSVTKASYDKENQRILVTIRNNVDETAYTRAKLGLILDGSPTRISGAGTREIEPNGLIIEEFPFELDEDDRAANQNVTVYLDYGAREGFLLKQDTYVLSLEEEMELPILLAIILVPLLLLLVVLVLFFFFYRKKKKPQPPTPLEGGKTVRKKARRR